MANSPLIQNTILINIHDYRLSNFWCLHPLPPTQVPQSTHHSHLWIEPTTAEDPYHYTTSVNHGELPILNLIQDQQDHLYQGPNQIYMMGYNQYLQNKPQLAGHSQLEVRLLQAQGYDVVVIDRMNYKNREKYILDNIFAPLKIKLLEREAKSSNNGTPYLLRLSKTFN